VASDRTVESPDARRALVARIAESSLFQKSPRLREFLVYVAECTLDGRPDDAREQAIAERLFHRTSDFAGQDSIVRAEARNLRKRLSLYFTTDGKDESMIVEMPKGGYMLTFVPRESQSAEPPVELVPIVLPPAAPELPERPAPRRENRWLWVVSAIAAIAALIAAGSAYYLYRSNHALRTSAASRPDRLPFSALFGNSMETMIVTSDTTLVPLFYTARQRISLDDYITRSYPQSSSVFSANLARAGEYTDAQEVAIAGQIIHANAPFARQIRLRSGHQVQLSDAKNYNMILLGSAYSNPWVQMFEDKLNFRLDLVSSGLRVNNRGPQHAESQYYPCHANIIVRNKAPNPGEAAEYPCLEHNQSYAAVAFLPSESGSGNVLLIAGTTAEATAAGGEFVLNAGRIGPALKAIGMDPGGAPHFFELLLRVNAFVGGSTQSDVVAARSAPYAGK